MGIIKTFFLSYWLTIIKVFLLAALVGGAYYKGYQDGSAEGKLMKAQAENMIKEINNITLQNNVQVEKNKVERAEITNKIVSKSVENQKKIKQKLKVRKINDYVTEKSNTDCIIPIGFVRLHDGSATGDLSGSEDGIPVSTTKFDASASRQAIDSPSKVTLQEVGETVNQNYEEYHLVRQQLVDLQDWIKEQQKLNEGNK